MSQAKKLDAAFSTERLIAASPHQVFAAFENPASLAEWWGPNGFTNTFSLFEFRPGGRWRVRPTPAGRRRVAGAGRREHAPGHPAARTHGNATTGVPPCRSITTFRSAVPACA